MLKYATEKMTQLLIAGQLEYLSEAKSKMNMQTRKFTPLFEPESHRYLEFVMLIKGSAFLKLQTGILEIEDKKVWTIIPNVIHNEGCVDKREAYQLLWGSVIPRGISFFISEHKKTNHQQVTERLFVELEDFNRLNKNLFNSDLSGDYLLQAELLSTLLRVCVKANHLLNEEQIENTAQSSQQEKVITQIQEYIQIHYKENVTIKELARMVGYTPNYLGALFLRFTNQTIHQYLLKYRLDTAVNLLINGHYQVKQVSHLVGFRDPLYFSRLVSKKYGKPPSAFIKG